MSSRTKRMVAAVVTVWLLAITCNIPAGVAPPVTAPPLNLSDEDLANTAVARILTAQPGQAASDTVETPPPVVPTDTLVPTATQCSPTIIATTNVNVRNGPGSVYDVIGALPTGATAPLAGRNDSGSWWYIVFPGGVNGYGWVSASYATAACAPQVVQVIAAPPTPTPPPPTETQKVSIPPLLVVTKLVFPILNKDIRLVDIFQSTG